MYARSCAFARDTGAWSLGSGVGAGTGPDGFVSLTRSAVNKRSTEAPRSDTVYLSPRRQGRAPPAAVMGTNASRMRSAAIGEHRTGEECLDGIGRRRAILPKRWAIGERSERRWCGASPGSLFSMLISLSRAKVLISPGVASGAFCAREASAPSAARHFRAGERKSNLIRRSLASPVGTEAKY
jgi:hypothetical protein